MSYEDLMARIAREIPELAGRLSAPRVTYVKSLKKTYISFESSVLAEERQFLGETVLSNPDNPAHGTPGGEDTTDRVFLLSIGEAEEYFSSNEARAVQVTDYAAEQGAMTWVRTGNSQWWLRSPGSTTRDAAYVDGGGAVNAAGCVVLYKYRTIRPSIVLRLPGA